MVGSIKLIGGEVSLAFGAFPHSDCIDNDSDSKPHLPYLTLFTQPKQIGKQSTQKVVHGIYLHHVWTGR